MSGPMRIANLSYRVEEPLAIVHMPIGFVVFGSPRPVAWLRSPLDGPWDQERLRLAVNALVDRLVAEGVNDAAALHAFAGKEANEIRIGAMMTMRRTKP